jgi:hypothetical protein
MQKEKEKRNCLWLFSLQTGVTIIVFLDFMFFIALMTVIIGQHTTEINDEKSGAKYQFIFFVIFTEGIIVALYLLKCYYGVRFLQYSLCPNVAIKKS